MDHLNRYGDNPPYISVEVTLSLDISVALTGIDGVSDLHHCMYMLRRKLEDDMGSITVQRMFLNSGDGKKVEITLGVWP